MYLCKTGIIDLTKPSLIGVISYTESNTGQVKEVKVYKHFWLYGAYTPNQTELRKFLHESGYTHILNPKFSRVM